MTAMEFWEMEAKEFAIKQHGDQGYGKGFPYWKHLEAVVQVAKQYGLPKEVVQAAWLHDVVEDTDFTLIELVKLFGQKVGKLVWAVTDDDPIISRQVRGNNTWVKISMVGELAVALKLCDRIANVEACTWSGKPELFDMYFEEYAEFKKTLKFQDHLTNLALWDRLDKLMKEGNHE